MSEKRRIDQLLVERGLAQSRQRAQSALMAGLVYVSGQRVDKAGALVAADAEIELRGEACPYVSRGGLKLARAVEAFGLDLRGRVCLDVGASTGGFTDCMLQQGAKKVYCVDVGYGQLAWSLRSDPRVVNLERTNVRGLTENEVGEPIDFASIDVSFISLKLVLPSCSAFCARARNWSPSSSRSLKRAGRKWAKTAWYGTRPCMRPCCARSPDSARKSAFPPPA